MVANLELMGCSFPFLEGGLLVGLFQSKSSFNVLAYVSDATDAIVNTSNASRSANGDVEVGKVAVEDFEGGSVVS